MHCIIISGSLLSCCLARGCARSLRLHSCCCSTPPHDQAVLVTSPRVKHHSWILGARPLSMQRPGTMFLHGGLLMLMHVLVWWVLRKEDGKRAGAAQDCAGFIKQTVESLGVRFLIHLRLHP